MLTLRALETEDCDVLESWITSADALFQWSGPWDFRWPLDRGRLRRDLAGAGAGERRRLLAAVDDGSGMLVGHAMLTIQPEHRLGVIGRVLIDPARRGRGLGVALMHEVVRVAFERLGLHRLQLAVYDFNVAAIAAYERAGFVIEGRFRDSTLGSGGYGNSYVMALLEDEYRPPSTEPRSVGRYVVRPAGVADAATVAGLLTELGYPQDAQQAATKLAEWASDPRGTVLVAELDGNPTGVIAAHAVPYLERPGSFVRVVALVVDPGHRRGGVGRRLLGAVEAWAAGLACRDIEVTSRRTRGDALAFYGAVGFADLGERSARFKRPLSAS
jgi:RimJ/RimL family protein N-acetyltransferase